ncbi:MAG: hypothetical protein AAGK34_02035 [Planctomycetota bacterium]|jgi:hypothetical protein|nr:MAG: hypothetical protein EVA77_08305 [Phycisphaeraceae bacterium]
MPRSILPILCTLALVPFLLLLGGATEIGSGLLHSLPSLGLAWLWWLSARGYGHWLLPNSSEMGPVVGVVGLVFLDQCLGRLGLMDLTSAWGLLALGLLGYRRSRPTHLGWPQMEWTWMLPLAVLGTAALVPPGWLWDTEFGGYDVLSYHLALPADWWTLGRMGPLTTNAYSGLPGGAESAFLHLHALSGGTHDVTGLAAQMLCAILTINTASLLRQKHAAAALVFLMTPWIMVTGSMAYTEAFVLFPACALTLHLRESKASGQACCLGLLAGGIALAKPSAALLLALPLALMYFAEPNRRQSKPVLLSVGIATIVSMPWLLDNTLTVGSPFFPLLTGVFGLGHWTAIQSANWEAAHTGGGSLAALWTEWLGYRSSGHWQWSVTPWLVLVGLGMAPQRDRIKDSLAIGSGLAVFVLLTHAQSRFLVPMLPLFALIAARPLSRLPHGMVWVMLLVPLATFLGQRQGLPTAAFGQAGVLDGRTPIPDAPPNPMAEVRSLPESAKVLGVGVADGWRFSRVNRHAVWDRGPFDDLDPNSLLNDGWTHVLVDDTMLQVWDRSGWNLPNRSWAEVQIRLTEAGAVMLQDYAGMSLWKLPVPTEVPPANP